MQQISLKTVYKLVYIQVAPALYMHMVNESKSVVCFAAAVGIWVQAFKFYK